MEIALQVTDILRSLFGLYEDVMKRYQVTEVRTTITKEEQHCTIYYVSQLTTGRQTDRQSDIQSKRQTVRQADSQTDRQRIGVKLDAR